MDPRTPGAGLHRHARLTETFAVESGALALHLDGTDIDLGPGDFAMVRLGRPHAFANRGDQPVRFTQSFTPALAREGFFEGLADLTAAGRLSDAEAMEHLMLPYDQEPLAGFDGWSARRGCAPGPRGSGSAALTLRSRPAARPIRIAAAAIPANRIPGMPHPPVASWASPKASGPRQAPA